MLMLLKLKVLSLERHSEKRRKEKREKKRREKKEKKKKEKKRRGRKENKGEDLEILNVLGKGAFASVYSCYDKSYKGKFAIKILKENASEEYVEMTKKEIALLKKMNHPQIMSFVADVTIDGKLSIVTPEFAGSLRKQLDTKKKEVDEDMDDWFNMEDITSWCLQILKGLNYLHNDMHIAHCDLKVKLIFSI